MIEGSTILGGIVSMKKKYSVIISYNNEKDDILRTYFYLKKQTINFEEIEIIIVSGIDQEKNRLVLSDIESNSPDSVILVWTEKGLSNDALFNIGIDYCSGEYILFLLAGDALNVKLFSCIDSFLDANSVHPDIISFQKTLAYKDFDLFEDDPFDLEKSAYCVIDSVEKRTELLHNSDLQEEIICYAIRRDFWNGAGIQITDAMFYALLFMAETVLTIPEHGYCKFYKDSDMTDVSGWIAQNMQIQLNTWELLAGIPEIIENYKEVITANFIKKYYLDTLNALVARDIEHMFSVEQFQAMQFVCLKIEPNWIENRYIYGLSRYEIELLKLLYKNFKDGKELHDALYDKQLVSVIITTYNRADKLGRAIDNILKQTYQRFELIIVDDGSTDNTEDVVKSFADERVRYIKNDTNKGVSFARNVGIANSHGNYIVYQDDDDLCRLDKLEKQTDYLKIHENVGMVYHETINHINRLEKKSDENIVMLPSRKMPDVKKHGFIFPALLPWNYVACTSMMIRKECIDDIGWFDEKLFAFEDWDLTLRIAKNYDVGFIMEPLYDYYQSSDGLLFGSDEQHRRKVVHALEIIDKKYEPDRKSYGIKSINRE